MDLYDQKTAVQTVLGLLRDDGYAAYVVGGAARDLHHGREPKDYDILILAEAEIEDVIEVLLERDDIISAMVAFGDGASMAPAEEAPRAHSRLDWVLKLAVSGVDIDVLKYTDDFETPQEAVENFDLSLNMAWVDLNGRIQLHPEYPARGELVRLLPRIDFPLVRVPYMAAKYPQYIYPTVSEIEAFLYNRAKEGI